MKEQRYIIKEQESFELKEEALQIYPVVPPLPVPTPYPVRLPSSPPPKLSNGFFAPSHIPRCESMFFLMTIVPQYPQATDSSLQSYS